MKASKPDVEGDERERREMRALATASHFLEALERECPALVVGLRETGDGASLRDAAHIRDGLGSLAELALALEQADASSRPQSVHGEIARALRDIAAAIDTGDAGRAAAVLDDVARIRARSWRHWFQSRLESKAGGDGPARS